MAITTTRAHGNAAIPERLAGDGRLENVDGHPYTDVVGFAQGWGKTFRVSNAQGKYLLSDWFHIPVPTITVLGDRRMFLENCYVFFSSDSREDGSDNTGWVRRIDLWDGSAKVYPSREFPTEFSGDWRNPRDLDVANWGRLSNTLVPRRPLDGRRIAFNTGLCMCIAVAGLPGSANITFHSAGATWIDADN